MEFLQELQRNPFLPLILDFIDALENGKDQEANSIVRTFRIPGFTSFQLSGLNNKLEETQKIVNSLRRLDLTERQQLNAISQQKILLQRKKY